jgi:3-phytase/alkaline phosphatase D
VNIVRGILWLLFTALTTAHAAPPGEGGESRPIRFATFNASLNRATEGELAGDLAEPGSEQPDVIAEIIQRVRPDVLLVNEIDFDSAGLAARRFQDNYLAVPHGDAKPIVYPYRFVAPVNTGIPSGFDLDNDGSLGGPGDAFGFGFFPGQFGMAVYSRFPIDTEGVRTFQHFLWKNMPDALLPVDPATGESWYSDEELVVLRLSSKSHWDIPILIPESGAGGEGATTTVHFLVSHPTPPVFDGPEDRNGKRNHDEIRFWADYVVPSESNYIYDDAGRTGGLPAGALFVIAGDQNADPFDGDSLRSAAQQVLDHPLVNKRIAPKSPGGSEQARLQGGNNLTHAGDPAFDTADFGEAGSGGAGNLRVDYVLPRKDLRIVDAGVFWPSSDDPTFPLVGTSPVPGSDHRLVWIDVAVPGW